MGFIDWVETVEGEDIRGVGGGLSIIDWEGGCRSCTLHLLHPRIIWSVHWREEGKEGIKKKNPTPGMGAADCVGS
jgi:hypothetical protein